MPVDIPFGAEWGASAVRGPRRTSERPVTGPATAVIDAGREVSVHLVKGGPAISDVTLADGSAVIGGVLRTDRSGDLPDCVLRVEDLDAAPGEVWLHDVDSHVGQDWWRVRLGGGATGSVGSGIAAGTVLGKVPVRWRWSGASMTDGTASQPFRITDPARIVDTVAAYAVGDPPSVPAVIELVYLLPGGGEVPVTEVTIPAGALSGESAPVSIDLGPGGNLVPRLVSAPPAAAAGVTPATLVASALADTGTGTASASTPFVAPLPAGGVAGDLLVVVASDQAPTMSMGAGWTLVASSNSVASAPAAPQSRTYVWTAPWSAAISRSIALSPFTPAGGATIGSSPVVATTLLIRGAAASSPVAVAAGTSTPNGSGGVVVTPAPRAPSNLDLAFVVVGWRAQSGVSGQAAAVTAGGMSSEIADRATSRDPAGNTNVGQAVYALGAVPAGVVASRTVTISGGTGDAGTLSTSAVVFGVRRTPGVSGPTALDLDVRVAQLATGD